MLLNELESSHRPCLSARRGSLGAGCLLVVLAIISCSAATATADPLVARHLGPFFEAYLGRELSGTELREVVDEFIRTEGGAGKSRDATHEAAEKLDPYTKILREQKDSPVVLNLRHRLIEANYFSPPMQNTTQLRLLTEPDPVRLVDPGAFHRLMTEKDVVALVNLNRFIKSPGEPHQQNISPQEIEQVVSGLKRRFGNSKASWMPRFFSDTAAFWAGVRQEWPHLSADEKHQVRAYARYGYEAPLKSYTLYGKLFGLNDAAAFDRSLADTRDAALFLAKGNLVTPIILDALTNPGANVH